MSDNMIVGGTFAKGLVISFGRTIPTSQLVLTPEQSSTLLLVHPDDYSRTFD